MSRVDVIGPALTFDDGPGEHTDALLDVLRDYPISVVFFVQGRAVMKRPELVKRAVEDGHQIGNHSWDHPILTKLDHSLIVDGLERTQVAIKSVTGSRPSMFRSPYGECNDSVRRAAARVGLLTHWRWDIDSLDWCRPGVEAIRNAIIEAQPGDIVLLHDAGAGACETIEAVRQALEATWRSVS